MYDTFKAKAEATGSEVYRFSRKEGAILFIQNF
jgi:hypothetical protein